jgi:hypothetical protein
MTLPNTVLKPQTSFESIAQHSTEFTRACSLLQAHNHLRRALEVLSKAQVRRAQAPLRRQADELWGDLVAMGAPDIRAVVAMKTDVDKRHPIELNIGLALCAFGAARIGRIQSELVSGLTELRTPDVVALLQTCARMGWEREIDRCIAEHRIYGSEDSEAELLRPALKWRIQRSPWRIIEHCADWRDQLSRARQIANSIEMVAQGKALIPWPAPAPVGPARAWPAPAPLGPAQPAGAVSPPDAPDAPDASDGAPDEDDTGQEVLAVSSSTLQVARMR